MANEYYSQEDIAKIADKYHEVKCRYEKLRDDIAQRAFSTPKGDEFAKHGFLRRCDMLWHCIQRTFEIIPPNKPEKPSRDETNEVAAFLHCFFIHTFGACDVLAWIIVHEKKIKKEDGAELPLRFVGFRKANKLVRGHLSQKMLGLLDSFDDWFKHVDGFRHSLAHRIPLYVPPGILRHDDEGKYNRLERESWDALVGGNLGKHKKLEDEKESLIHFRPWFTHSFSENAPHVVIHPQMIADFDAVLELGEASFQEF